MNNKQCKKLRRQAEQFTVGQPSLAYTTGNEGKLRSNGIDPLTGNLLYYTAPNQVVLTSCTRLVYRILKRNYIIAMRDQPEGKL